MRGTAPEWEMFRKRIWRWRHRYHLSVEEMGWLMGRRQATIKRLEAGKLRPQATTILRFAALEERYRQAQAEEAEMEALEGWR